MLTSEILGRMMDRALGNPVERATSSLDRGMENVKGVLGKLKITAQSYLGLASMVVRGTLPPFRELPKEK